MALLLCRRLKIAQLQHIKNGAQLILMGDNTTNDELKEQPVSLLLED